ncbi:flagellar hook-associated protein FlgK [Caminibacter sp.]
MAISSSLSTALTGLKAHQTAIETTSNNISNASNPDYVRERAVFSTLPAINSIPGDIGTGVEISKIYRITDTFLFNRLSKTGSELKKYDQMETYLKEIGTYFPDVQDEGLFKNIKDFFNSWQNLASNPNDGSVKVELAQKSIALSDTFHQLSSKLKDIQKSINGEIKSRVDEANNILKQIANLNKQINAHEANGLSNANELRDKRDALEKRLKEILDVKVFKNDVQTISAQGDETTDYSKDYQITIGGYPLIDNGEYSELQIVDNKGNYDIAIKKQDGSLEDITKSAGGEIGGLLEIRGYEFNDDTTPKDGILGEMFTNLNALAQGMIRSVNSIYSYSAQPSVQTDALYHPISISPDMANKPLPLLNSVLKNPVKDGNMILDIYDNNENKTDEVSVAIDHNKSINQIIDDINNALNGKTDTKAALVNGQIKFITPDGKESPNVLVKDDGSLLFKALNQLEYLPLDKINNTDIPIPLENGSFDIVAYDSDGNVLAKRKITINMDSPDPRYSTIEGIIAQINTPNIDDNGDNNPNNDIDDLYQAKMINGQFILSPQQNNIYVGLDEDSANFGGAFGVNKFFDGNSADTIKLRDDLQQNPSNIHAYKAPNEGNNEVANAMLQLQFENITFHVGNTTTQNTITGFYSQMTSSLANQTDIVSSKKETTQTLYKSIQNEYYSIAGVNIDEELINLEKYQRGYQANARVITTINQMLDALFGIKQ